MVSAGRGNGRGPCPDGAPSPGSAFRPDGAHRFSPAAPAIVALTSWKRCRTLIGSSASPVRESRTSGARGPSPLDSPESPSSGGSTGRRSWRATLPVSSPLTSRRQSPLGREPYPRDGPAAMPSVLPRRARLLPAHVLAGGAKRLPHDGPLAWATWRARQRTPLNRRTSKTRPRRAGAATRAL